MKICNLHGVPHGDSHEDPQSSWGVSLLMNSPLLLCNVYEQSRLKFFLLLWAVHYFFNCVKLLRVEVAWSL